MLELSLTHDGDVWIAQGVDISFRAITLKELDNQVRSKVKSMASLEDRKSGKIKVSMTFDNAVIPQWIRQYANHYFNRLLIVEL